MAIDKITPNDERIKHEYAELNGKRYHYIDAKPAGTPKATIVLIHGWPDLSYGWRFQIPFLQSLGFRVIAPDMMGYGGTDAPQVPPAGIELYAFKRAADDIATLCKALSIPHIILGGHDWGGMVVYRTAQWHPQLVSHVFSVCTPFFAVQEHFSSTEDVVRVLPHFGYQLHLASAEVEGRIKSREDIKQFLQGTYGGRAEGGRVFFSPETGIDLSTLGGIGAAPLLDNEELEYYTDQFAIHGLHGPLNWYRTRKANYDDDLKLETRNVPQPVLFISATKDSVLKPEMAAGMERHIKNLTKRQVAANHWALTETPSEVNGHIEEWLEDVVFGTRSVL